MEFSDNSKDPKYNERLESGYYKKKQAEYYQRRKAKGVVHKCIGCSAKYSRPYSAKIHQMTCEKALYKMKTPEEQLAIRLFKQANKVKQEEQEARRHARIDRQMNQIIAKIGRKSTIYTEPTPPSSQDSLDQNLEKTDVKIQKKILRQAKREDKPDRVYKGGRKRLAVYQCPVCLEKFENATQKAKHRYYYKGRCQDK